MSKSKGNFIKEKDMTKSFRLKNNRVMLTYKSHLDKTKYIDWIENEICNKKCKFIRIAHETAHKENDWEKKIDYIHSHVLIDFGYSFETTSCHKFDFDNGEEKIHPNIGIITSTQHWGFAVKYLGKEDIENADLLEEVIKENLVEKIWKSETIQEALVTNIGEKLANATAIIQIFNLKKNDEKRARRIMDESIFRPWQVTLNEILKKTPNDRDVIWIVDEVGKTGKSKFTKHLAAVNNDTISISNTGRINDFSTIIANELMAGWTGRTIIFDLPRKSKDYDISACIEDVKNGKITATKYNGMTMYFDEPHVVIFANYLPKPGELSLDRWRVYEVTSDYQLASINIKEMLIVKKRFTRVNKNDKDKEIKKAQLKLLYKNMLESKITIADIEEFMMEEAFEETVKVVENKKKNEI